MGWIHEWGKYWGCWFVCWFLIIYCVYSLLSFLGLFKTDITSFILVPYQFVYIMFVRAIYFFLYAVETQVVTGEFEQKLSQLRFFEYVSRWELQLVSSSHDTTDYSSMTYWWCFEKLSANMTQLVLLRMIKVFVYPRTQHLNNKIWCYIVIIYWANIWTLRLNILHKHKQVRCYPYFYIF